MRTTNLIQSYITNNPSTQQYKSDKVSKNFDVHRELTNRTFIKPLPSNGKLLNPTIMDYPAEIQKDIKSDIKAFYHAIKGEANDHELGRLNDVGMKFGGLALAAYLFTKKQTPKTKLFEFIGLGTFFAAMDIWPKLFIQLPAQLLHGVNVRQQYEDSFGRKKMFYQDHQFIPWDLYSDNEINKIGDRLGVPKDMPNRRNAIQEKMRKIALQNNTLWMLTAGFATPLMSALICNSLEKGVNKLTDSHMDKKANNLLTNFPNEIAKYDYSKQIQELMDILSEYEQKPISQEMFNKVFANLSNGLDKVVADALEKDLKILMPQNKKYTLSEKGINGIQAAIREVLKPANLSEEVISDILPDKNKLIDQFNSRGLLNGEYDDLTEHSKIIQNMLEENINKVSASLDETSQKKLRFLADKLVHSPVLKKDSPLSAILKQEPAVYLTKQMKEIISKVANMLNTFKAESNVLDKYAYIKVAQAPETGLANMWNEMSDELFKVLKFNSEEINLARIDNEVASEILRSKMEQIVSNKDSYSKFVNKMESLLSKFYGKFSYLDKAQDESANVYKTLVNSTCNDTSRELLGCKMRNTAIAINGILDGQDNVVSPRTSSRQVMLTFVEDRVKGVKTSFYRFLNFADMYYRIANIQGDTQVLNNRVPKEVKEEMVELAKQIIIDGHSSDFAVKFMQRRNPQPNKQDYSQIECRGGKVVNKYFGKEGIERVEFANDRHYFDSVMKLMYGEDLHPDTYKILEKSGFLEDFKKYRNDVLTILGGDKYFAKPNHLVNGQAVASSSEERFILTGCAPSEIAHKAFNNKFNSSKWFTMFGKLGIGLVGVTLLAQFFLGRTKYPKQNKEVK